LLAESADRASNRELLLSVRTRLDNGYSLSQSLAFVDVGVSARILALIKLGEKSGGLGRILELVAEELEAEIRMRAKVQSATVYPFALAGLSLIFIVGLLWFFIPRIVELTESLQAELPWLVRTILSVARTLLDPLILFIGLQALLGVGLLLKKWGEREVVRVRLDKFLLDLPVLGQLFLQLNTYQLCTSLATMLRCGSPLVQGLELATPTLGNRYLRNVVESCTDDIRYRGFSLSEALREKNIFPRSLDSFLACAEEAGTLEYVLDITKGYYSNRMEEIVEQAVPLMETAVLLLMGGVVGVITMALFLPVVRVISSL
jgi:general secretion pathway protein F